MIYDTIPAVSLWVQLLPRTRRGITRPKVGRLVSDVDSRIREIKIFKFQVLVINEGYLLVQNHVLGLVGHVLGWAYLIETSASS